MEIIENNSFVPFNADDVQIEFKLLDPVIVKYMNRIGDGKYECIFQTPDKFGVYTLIFDYKRPFLSYLEHKETIPLRTFRSTQVDRFGIGNYPFYVACGLMLFGFILFSFFYLHYEDENKELTKTD